VPGRTNAVVAESVELLTISTAGSVLVLHIAERAGRGPHMKGVA